MSEIQAHPENEEEYEDRRQELITDAAETKQELDQKQEEALAEIESGETFEKYGTATLGELELEVRAWIDGQIMDDIQDAQELAQSGDPERLRDSIAMMLDVLARMTVDDTFNVDFWESYYRKWGPEAIQRAMESILEPAREEQEAKMESLDGFRPNVKGAKPRTRGGVNE